VTDQHDFNIIKTNCDIVPRLPRSTGGFHVDKKERGMSLKLITDVTRTTRKRRFCHCEASFAEAIPLQNTPLEIASSFLSSQ
jgi:hypothetical protein